VREYESDAAIVINIVFFLKNRWRTADSDKCRELCICAL
jgi:hypothetical protein